MQRRKLRYRESKIEIESVERERERGYLREQRENCEDVWLPQTREQGTHRFVKLNTEVG